MSHTCTPMFKSYLSLSMVFTIFFAPYFLPSRHPSSYVSTHQQHILPVQITGWRVVVRADKYCQDVLDHEHLGHVKGHKLWVCDDTRWPCGILRLPVCRRVQFWKHDIIQICDMCFIHRLLSERTGVDEYAGYCQRRHHQWPCEWILHHTTNLQRWEQFWLVEDFATTCVLIINVHFC